jgi:Zn finger protein HypA/HybF involved in hydrogenase expression
MLGVTTLHFDCPRCHESADAEHYGPCPKCRAQLRATMGGEQREIEAVAYEPKMNVVPNQVATKD